MKAVLFDLGNTLLEYRDFGLEAYSVRLEKAMVAIVGLMREAGMIDGGFDPAPLTRAIFERIIGLEQRAWRESFEYDTTSEILRALGERFARIDKSWDRRIDGAIYGVMRKEYAPRADAVATLRALRRAGLRTGMISNTQFRSANLMEEMRAFGFADLMDAMIFSIDLGVRKPLPAVFNAALERLGVGAQDAVMVGDTVDADVEGGRAMGMRTILMRTPHNAEAVARGDHHADAVVEALSEIPPLLSKWR